MITFRGADCKVVKGTYPNGRTGLQLFDIEDGSPMCKPTVNIPDVDVPDGHVLIKNYSECKGVLNALVEGGVVQPTGETVKLDFVSIPICKLLI